MVSLLEKCLASRLSGWWNEPTLVDNWSLSTVPIQWGACGGIVVKALRYYSDGPRIDSWWCHWGFFSDIFPSDRTMALGLIQPLVKMSTRNIPGGKSGRCVRLTSSPPSCAQCHELWEPKPPGTLWTTPGLLQDSFTFTYTVNCTNTVSYGHSSACVNHIRGSSALVNVNFIRHITFNAELNPICHLLALFGAHHILHVSRLRVKK
jgi:hypothetical protein